MGWIERCFETYENNLAQVGKPVVINGWEKPMLLPVAHTTQKVQLELSLTDEGEYISTEVLTKDDMTTVIPCTEESSARTSGPVPHPLVDKLQYIAGDYKQFGGPKKSMWKEYLKQLRAWCQSPYAHPKVGAVLTYLEQGKLIRDLVRDHILFCDNAGRLLTKWNGDKEAEPPIFKLLLNGDQFETFVRFRVGGDALAKDAAVWESYTRYYESQMDQTDYCFVQGKPMIVSQLSPYKIRNAGDRAKLISSNDSANFTYRGRFETPQQAFSIGYETTQKAHSALRWLIGLQGVQTGDQTILVWGTKNERMPKITGNTYQVAVPEEDDDLGEAPIIQSEKEDTEGEIARRFNEAVLGFRLELTITSKVTVMVLDSATPGRLSIRYYRELDGSQLMDSVQDWHHHFAWDMVYWKYPKKGKAIPISYHGAPSFSEIAKAAYGDNVDDKLRQQTYERLLPCVTEGKPFPRDLMVAIVNRVAAGVSLSYSERQKLRNIACAMITGYHYRNLKEDISTMSKKQDQRSYLFGRVLACLDQVERVALRLANANTGENIRPTNAQRLEFAFTKKPAKTTMLLKEKVAPYWERLGKARGFYERVLNDLLVNFTADDSQEDKVLFDNTPLNEMYILGYAHQIKDFYTKRSEESQNEE